SPPTNSNICSTRRVVVGRPAVLARGTRVSRQPDRPGSRLGPTREGGVRIVPKMARVALRCPDFGGRDQECQWVLVDSWTSGETPEHACECACFRSRRAGIIKHTFYRTTVRLGRWSRPWRQQP